MKTRFELDFDFCTSFYEKYKSFSQIDCFSHSHSNLLSLIHCNQHTHHEKQKFYQITLSFFQNQVDIRSYYRELYSPDPMAYESECIKNPEIRRGNKLAVIRHTVFLSESAATHLAPDTPNKEFFLRLSTYLTIHKLDQFAKSHPDVEMPVIPLDYRCELTMNQYKMLRLLGIELNPAGLTANMALKASPHEEIKSALTSVNPKKTCSIS